MKFLVIIIIAAAAFFGYQKYTSYQQAQIEAKKEAEKKAAAQLEAKKKAEAEALKKKQEEEKKFVLEPENIYNLFQKQNDVMVNLFRETSTKSYISDCFNKTTDTQKFDQQLALAALNCFKDDLAKFCTLKDYKYFRMPPITSLTTPLYYTNAYRNGIKMMLIAAEYLCTNYKHDEGFIMLKEALIMQNKFRYPSCLVTFFTMQRLDIACLNTIKRLLSTQNLAQEDIIKLKDYLPNEADYAKAAKRALDGELEILLLSKKTKKSEFYNALKGIPENELKDYFVKYQTAFCKSIEAGNPSFPKFSDTKHQNFFKKVIYFKSFIKCCKVPKL
jgi:hypothetical protein